MSDVNELTQELDVLEEIPSSLNDCGIDSHYLTSTPACLPSLAFKNAVPQMQEGTAGQLTAAEKKVASNTPSPVSPYTWTTCRNKRHGTILRLDLRNSRESILL